MRVSPYFQEQADKLGFVYIMPSMVCHRRLLFVNNDSELVLLTANNA